MKKDLGIILGLFVLLGTLIIFGGNFTSIGFLLGGNTPKAEQGTIVQAKNLSLKVDIAKTAKERQKGLAGRQSLDINRGLLFVFDKSSNWGIWMKDMKFPIDVIWIDENKKIVDIASSVTPEPGKSDKELTIYKPRGPALYILEINAGLSKSNGLSVGDAVNFSL